MPAGNGGEQRRGSGRARARRERPARLTHGTCRPSGGFSAYETHQPKAQGSARPPRQEVQLSRSKQSHDRRVRAGRHGRRAQGVIMSEVMEPMVHEDQLPGHESELEPKPDWAPRYKGSDRLKGKVALITGGDSGIGRAVAALFAREGADIAILYLCEHDDAAKTRAIVEEEGRQAITIAGDLGDPDFCRKSVQQVMDGFGRLDILVNNAGEQHPDKEITDISED